MRPYPPELDNATELANKSTVAAEEINAAAGTAETETKQFAAALDIGAKAIQSSSDQIDKDLAAHTTAAESAEEAKALHAQANFGPNNDAAGQVGSNLSAALQDIADKRSTLAQLQHTLALGDAAGFDERRAQINGIDVRALMESCAKLLEEQHTLQRRIQGLITARKAEFATVKGVQSILGKAAASAGRAEEAANENAENSPVAIAYKLRTIEAALGDAPTALTRLGGALSQVITLIDAANDLANEWQHAGPMPDVVPQVQHALNTAKDELGLPAPELFDNARMQVGLSAKAVEHAVRAKQTAKEANREAATNMASVDNSLTEYIVTRGG